MGHANTIPCRMIMDTGLNVTIIRTGITGNLGETLLWTLSCATLQTVTYDKIQFHGKIRFKITFETQETLLFSD